MSLRDTIRSKTVGAPKHFKKNVVKVEDVEVEVRQMSVKDRLDIFNKASNGEGGVDPLKFQLWSVIYSCYVPGTNERIYEEYDYDSLVSVPTGSFVDILASEATKLMNVSNEENPT
jgi:hypothetical protein